jgi:hypothetical protein
MLRTGMAVVYESGGAEYGPWGLEKMKQVEAEAKYVPLTYRTLLVALLCPPIGWLTCLTSQVCTPWDLGNK